MRSTSARILFAFILLSKSSVSWQYPTAQSQRRPPRDIIFPNDPTLTLTGTRVAGGENSQSPSGVAAIFGGSRGPDGIHSLPAPPIVIPREVKPRPNREELILQNLEKFRKAANSQRTSVGRPSAPVIRPGSFVVNDGDLVRFFQNCGEFLERCQGANIPTGSHSHVHNRPVRNDGFQSGHVHSPFSRPSLPGNIPIWPG
ncbi:uncharacterized protein [Palaemon carinicauda]|uniref:uncharacterized protein n=1 Tax=Palaemon carinicauda TaxID=392227 RepID=UPI0035B6215B